MTTVTTLTGSIEIAGVTIPVDTPLPPTTAGHLIFKYDLPAGAAPTSVVSVGDFTSWLTSQLGVGDLNLPTSLESLSIGVAHLLINTAGVFEIAVLFGTMTNGTWDPSWKPIDALPFTFKNMRLETDYGLTVLVTSAATDSAGTVLTFAATTGITAGMAVGGTGIAGNTTVASTTATTVTLSAATTAAVPVGTTITFTPS